MSKKSPAFQFYPNDWLSSPTTQIMTAEQEGAYIRLLCFCWQDEDISLKDDDEYLAALARISKGGIRVVKAAFNQHPTKQGYLTHNRLQKEHEVQLEWRRKSSEGGKKSAESKRNFKGGSRVVQPNVNQTSTKFNSSSSSSSSSSKEKKEAFALPDFIKKEKWDDFIEMRIKARKAPTYRAKELLVAKLQKFKDYGEDIDAIIDQSILKGWQDFFSLSKTNNFGAGVQQNKPKPGLLTGSDEWKKATGRM